MVVIQDCFVYIHGEYLCCFLGKILNICVYYTMSKRTSRKTGRRSRGTKRVKGGFMGINFSNMFGPKQTQEETTQEQKTPEQNVTVAGGRRRRRRKTQRRSKSCKKGFFW